MLFDVNVKEIFSESSDSESGRGGHRARGGEEGGRKDRLGKERERKGERLELEEGKK